jgi:hypothetical protein
MTRKSDFYDRVLTRIVRIGIVLGAAGAIFTAVKYGPRIALGFVAGAILSILNFHGLRRLVEGLEALATQDTDGPPDAAAPKKPVSAGLRGSWVFWVLRYAIFFGAAYVIVKGLNISLMPVLAGLFVVAAAILVEITYELTYARK